MTKLVLCGALISLIPLSAQDSEKAVVEKKMAELKSLAAGFQVLGGEMISGKTVKGAPYSAQAVNESVQALADGNRITNSHSSMLYRDSQGRERREESLGGGVSAVFISDPMDGVSYNLEPHSKIAHKSSMHTFSFTTSNPATSVLKAEGEAKLRAAKTENRTVMITSSGGTGGNIGFVTRDDFNSSKADVKTENLGMQVIEGVSAEGTRTTMTIPAGQIGNEQPLVTTTERWYSSDLQTVVMTKRSDPRTGTTTYKLTNINRSEPAATLFQVPSDYTVAEPETMRRTFIQKEENQ
jgi:hypothetical protein